MTLYSSIRNLLQVTGPRNRYHFANSLKGHKAAIRSLVVTISGSILASGGKKFTLPKQFVIVPCSPEVKQLTMA